MGFAGALNWAWMLRCRGETKRLQAAAQRVPQVQADLLLRTVAANRNSAYGRQFGFDKVCSVADFQARVPLCTYDDLAPWIERAARGEPAVLTEEPVLLFEPTGGSTGGEKLIPYTTSLRAEFQRGVAAWIADLFAARPRVRAGRAYWSISPALGARRKTAGGAAIGFDDDAAYLGRWEQRLVRRVLAVPSHVAQFDDLESFRYTTLLYLLAARDLSLISIWHPTFLLRLLAAVEPWQERLCGDLRSIDARRAAEVAAVFRSRATPAERWGQLWPQLALISCWTDAAATLAARELQALFPSVEVQGKGLLATEAFVTLPLVGKQAPALALRSHFFEFLESEGSSDGGKCLLAHQLERGGRYQTVVTTSGGLYRYRLHDEVLVADHWGNCPLLQFVGKTDRTSDLVGEKLSEAHVQRALEALFAGESISPRFALLAPAPEPLPRYRLYLQWPEGMAGADAANWAKDLHAQLSHNPHYSYAVGLGQLAPAEIYLLPSECDAPAIYERQCLARRQRLGNIKPSVLSDWPGWAQLFGPQAGEQAA